MLEDAVIEFLSCETAMRRRDIRLDSQLASDLGIAGDDGVEIMDKFAKTFSVDLTGLDCVEYFGEEGGFNPLQFFLQCLFSSAPKLKPLSVRDLVEWAKRGTWRSGDA
jgi:hypothetical protein